MRYKVLDFLPLLVALTLIGAWFGFQQPLPWLSQAQGVVQPAMQQLAPPPSTPQATVVSRATAIHALCDPRQPRFLGTLATLRARLGGSMGDAVDCERAVDADGNTQQQTTTGLAYYRRALNVAVFTNGWEHWALTSSSQVLYWAGDDVEPPASARPAS